MPTASELARLIRTRRVSPVEVVEHYLARIHALDPTLSAFLTVADAEARAAARAAEAAVMAGGELPPLHGVPIAVKDLDFTRGLRTTGGSLAYKDFVPDEDAVAVERLRRAGAIILGKTNTPELGSYSEVVNRLGDDGKNPWDPTRTPGGSSGGSAAAVAAGLAPWATGTDGAGSIRMPAAFCGVYGLKPTFGLVPQHGGFLALPTYSVIGPITRTIRDAALMLGVIAGHDPRDPHARRAAPPDFRKALARPLGRLRVAWSPDLGFVDVDPEVRSAARSAVAAFEELGCVVEEATPPVGEEFFAVGEPVRNTDKYAAFGHLLQTHPGATTPYIQAVFERARAVSAVEYATSLQGLARMKARVAEFFERYDLLATPTTAFPAFPVRQPPIPTIAGQTVPPYASAVLLTLPWNLTGQPAASVPCGLSGTGLPIGLQLVGRVGDDAGVLRASAAFEEARPWAGMLPASARG
jgi:aspartyl-tRNA(Asn)/glutamyl-tRNA(Gln) amidotransferase subunit A